MHLWIPVPETMSLNVKRIASSLGPSIEQFTLPLDAAKRMQVTMWSTNDISCYDGIQLEASDAVPTTTDTLTIGGVVHAIIEAVPVNPGGVVVIYKVQARV